MQKSETFVRTKRVQCEAILEPMNEQELCENYQKGICKYSEKECYYKHYSCAEPHTCENDNCWFGHNEKRTKKSQNRPEYRMFSTLIIIHFISHSSNAIYRFRRCMLSCQV